MEGIADGDGDGVLNLFDQCRYTPEELKDRVFEDGCLCHDSDGGFNYLREGTVTYRLIDGEDTNTDHCADGTLVEYACDPNYEYRESDPVRSREVECTALGSNYQCRRNRCIPVVEAIPYLCWSSEGTCADGIQNQGEEGVDCGGICPPCNTHCTSGTRYAPPDTPCTTHYPDDPYRIDLPWTDNELEYTCQFHEVCHPELDHIIEEALRCCSIPTTRTGVTDEESERLYFEATSSLPDPVLCRVARGMAEGRGGGCQNCVGFYILKGLGVFSRWMVGYTWLYPDHNVYENVSQLPAEQLVNDYQTGICRDYAEVVPTLLRKAGFAQEDVGGRCDGNHCYNAVRLPGDRAWHVVDTTGNQLGIVLGGLPGYGAYPYCSRFNEANWCWGDSRSNGDPCTGTELYERDHASNCEPGFTCNRDLHSIPGWAPPYSEIIDCGY